MSLGSPEAQWGNDTQQVHRENRMKEGITPCWGLRRQKAFEGSENIFSERRRDVRFRLEYRQFDYAVSHETECCCTIYQRVCHSSITNPSRADIQYHSTASSRVLLLYNRNEYRISHISNTIWSKVLFSFALVEETDPQEATLYTTHTQMPRCEMWFDVAVYMMFIFYLHLHYTIM